MKAEESLQHSRISTEKTRSAAAEDLVDVSSSKTLGAVYQRLSESQWEKINEKGYGFLTRDQLEYIYGDQAYNKTYMQFDVKEYESLDEIQKQEMLYDWLLLGRRRLKRQAEYSTGVSPELPPRPNVSNENYVFPPPTVDGPGRVSCNPQPCSPTPSSNSGAFQKTTYQGGATETGVKNTGSQAEQPGPKPGSGDTPATDYGPGNQQGGGGGSPSGSPEANIQVVEGPGSSSGAGGANQGSSPTGGGSGTINQG